MEEKHTVKHSELAQFLKVRLPVFWRSTFIWPLWTIVFIVHVIYYGNMPPKGYKEIQVRQKTYEEFKQVCKDMHAKSYDDCLQKLILLYYRYKLMNAGSS